MSGLPGHPSGSADVRPGCAAIASAGNGTVESFPAQTVVLSCLPYRSQVLRGANVFVPFGAAKFLDFAWWPSVAFGVEYLPFGK
ncbi:MULTISPECIES: hypothetical protein [Rhodococcus]|uniref:hypothetical protein n=1 Tax=Rhodococcus TaxID=1827 RepID=UPI00130537CF|nr:MULTISPECIES: hypothetical protein [Rhodococcus erythropolis group]